MSNNYDPVLASGKKILCIEDNPLEQMLLTRVLKIIGLDACMASTALEGLNMAAAIDPGLILLDMHLPEMDGSEVLQRLRKQTHLNKVPVVMVTANVWGNEKQELLDAGASEVLTKPILPEVLRQTLHRLM
ncbi:Response regulator receiver domain-containing protein [Chitinophaga costaii]|uniref:Response regulator receiver domain-containing protein n=1 Tax=Chitinophaga costaii TaxID=1335309 RepID=A0A1C4DDH3_9BACT|nr:response regulator [Chitinophaga costaii]SCC29422.1 Response regulator receiver domain-containing protein [Chitinophaga costaii]